MKKKKKIPMYPCCTGADADHSSNIDVDEIVIIINYYIIRKILFSWYVKEKRRTNKGYLMILLRYELPELLPNTQVSDLHIKMIT